VIFRFGVENLFKEDKNEEEAKKKLQKWIWMRYLKEMKRLSQNKLKRWVKVNY
jgi:hypothetical protein